MDGEVTAVFDPPAARLRMKGKTVRVTRDGVATDYLVTKVLMPDEFGRVTIKVTAA